MEQYKIDFYSPKIEMLNVKQVREIFGCSLKSVYQLVNANGFPTIRIGRKILVENEH